MFLRYWPCAVGEEAGEGAGGGGWGGGFGWARFEEARRRVDGDGGRLVHLGTRRGRGVWPCNCLGGGGCKVARSGREGDRSSGASPTAHGAHRDNLV